MHPLRRAGVSPVIAVILLVAITVVLTAVLYVVVQDIAKQTQTPPPNIFIDRDPEATNSTFLVLGVSDPRPLADFKAKLLVDGAEDPGSTVDPLAPATVGALTFQDTDGGGRLSQGDKFFVTVSSGRSYELVVFWRETLVDSVAWQT